MERVKESSGLAAKKWDYTRLFEQALRMPVLAIVTMPRAGSDFFQSLLDGHPQILQVVGQFQFYPFWEGALCKENLSDLIDEFIWHPKHLVKFKSQYQKEERWDRLGGNRNEHFQVDMVVFREHLLALLEGRPITSRNFFVGVHLAYALASGFHVSSDCKLLVCHLHEHYHLRPFLDDFPEARVIYCTRDPRNALVSTVEHLLVEPDRRNPYFFKYWLKWIIEEADQVARLTKRVKTLPLEHLHLTPEKTLKEFCGDFGLDFHPCLLNSTFQGKQWWGDCHSPRFLKGFNFSIGEPKWEGRLTRMDVFLLEVLLFQRLQRYGYPIRAKNSWGSVLLALLSIPIPAKYEIELARFHLTAQRGPREKTRSLFSSIISYLDRVLFYYQTLWRERRPRFTPPHYA